MFIQINSDEAPKAIGPYSQAIQIGGFLFVSGQLPLNPSTGSINHESMEAQTHQVLSNIRAILTKARINFSHVVSVDIFLTDLKDFAMVNALYAEAFSHPLKPARKTIEVAALPLNAKVEIALVAKVPLIAQLMNYLDQLIEK